MTVATSSPDLAELLGILDEEIRLYGELLALAARERTSIVSSDSDELTLLVRAKEALVSAVAQAESRRLEWLEAWGGGQELPEGPTLRVVLEALPPAEATSLARRRDMLLERLRQVAEMNYRNGQLLESSLRIVGRTIDAFNKIRDAAGYHPTGEPTTSARTAVLDYRA